MLHAYAERWLGPLTTITAHHLDSIAANDPKRSILRVRIVSYVSTISKARYTSSHALLSIATLLQLSMSLRARTPCSKREEGLKMPVLWAKQANLRQAFRGSFVGLGGLEALALLYSSLNLSTFDMTRSLALLVALIAYARGEQLAHPDEAALTQPTALTITSPGGGAGWQTGEGVKNEISWSAEAGDPALVTVRLINADETKLNGGLAVRLLLCLMMPS